MDHDPGHLHAIVDMGSNGIRFSISSLQPPTARIMPTLYQSRAAIPLYDAQYSSTGERQPIPEATINDVISSFKIFRSACQDFGVPENQIVVLATEATRTAINSVETRTRIKDETGRDVRTLSKEEEGRVGAMGIRSSLLNVSGLVMDLGGGSTQLSWLDSKTTEGDVSRASRAISMRYGAAALSKRLAEATKAGTTQSLDDEVRKALRDAYRSLEVPASMVEKARGEGGLILYLSGGGFRGWGYILMSKHTVQPYPIPVINGFKAGRRDFVGTSEIQAAAASALQDKDENIFGISDRRASQVPAVAFLINALAEELPDIKEVRFCQGGVREGYLFSSLGPEVQAQHPLVVATKPFAPPSADVVTQLLVDSLPPNLLSNGTHQNHPISPELLRAFANTLYTHASAPKDIQPSASLRSTSTGILSSVHGLLHESRALLALLLCARWAGEVPPADLEFKKSLEAVVADRETLWRIKYLGAVGTLIGSVYPAGVVREGEERVALAAEWSESKKGEKVLRLVVKLRRDFELTGFQKEAERIEKVGKKKNWVGAKEGVGYKVEVVRDALDA